MSIQKIGAVLVLVALVAPLATANHGLNGRLDGVLSNGSKVTAFLTYVTGNFNSQTWRFDFSSPSAFTCFGFGSVEVGFTGVSCATAWSTGGTGDQHNFPSNRNDIHTVDVAVGGASGTALQIVCADGGPDAAQCNGLIRTIPR